ncbi:MAG TPA: transcriptional regulator GcvA [Hyphomicrobiaceae bacterium]|jgi:LysR family glycine cleavage system transcriptional activator|nr:transcriptional regulator GcvA [Hyphomicrobiaceae bacterium]
MPQKRFNLPPLDFIQGFEAAARTLSFTRAADELSITQSAVSRQIRALEEYLGVPLFERRPRSLALTEQGHMLYAAAVGLLEQLQAVTDRVRAHSGSPHLTVTTTGGFASLWLIPRLRRFMSRHPDVDVRISATYKTINLERSLVDVAVRYCLAEEAPPGAVRLFGEDLFPVCSPALQAEGPRPLRTFEDLAHHVLLHMDEAAGMLDWGTWLTAHGLPDLKPASSIRFDSYEQMIQAALGGQGVALGIGRLVSALMQAGQLIAPFGEIATGSRSYFIIASPLTGDRQHVKEFVTWLVEEAQAVEMAAGGVTSPLPAAPSVAAARRRRSAR